MSIVIDENIVGLWYVMTGEKDDFMLALSHYPEGLQIIYRHRYYHSADPWDEKDIKKWTRCTIGNKDEQRAIEVAREMVKSVAFIAMKMEKLKAVLVHELLKGDKTVEQFFEAFKNLPFVHAKTVQ